MQLTKSRIRWVIEKSEETIEQLADEFHLSIGGMRKIQYGQRLPSYSVLKSFCEYFNVSSDFLLGLEDEPDLPYISNLKWKMNSYLQFMQTLKENISNSQKKMEHIEMEIHRHSSLDSRIQERDGYRNTMPRYSYSLEERKRYADLSSEKEVVQDMINYNLKGYSEQKDMYELATIDYLLEVIAIPYFNKTLEENIYAKAGQKEKYYELLVSLSTNFENCKTIKTTATTKEELDKLLVNKYNGYISLVEE